MHKTRPREYIVPEIIYKIIAEPVFKLFIYIIYYKISIYLSKIISLYNQINQNINSNILIKISLTLFSFSLSFHQFYFLLLLRPFISHTSPVKKTSKYNNILMSSHTIKSKGVEYNPDGSICSCCNSIPTNLKSFFFQISFLVNFLKLFRNKYSAI